MPAEHFELCCVSLIETCSGAARGDTVCTCPPPPLHVGGPNKVVFYAFSCKIFIKTTFNHICKMKWTKSEKKIEIGGPREVRGRSGWHPPIANVWLRHWRRVETYTERSRSASDPLSIAHGGTRSSW